MSIFDATVHMDMHENMRKSLLALWERMTIIESSILSNRIDDSLRITRIQDALTARVNGIDAILAAYCIDALQLKPTSTPERCHIDGCMNPLPPYIFPFCAKCGLPTCTAHVYEHPATTTDDDADNTAGWCKTCEPGVCHIEPCRNRILQGYRAECTNCGDPTCPAHLTMLGIEVDEDEVDRALFWCDNCIAKMNTPATTTDDGPSTCYICCRDHDLEDCATCMTCLRTVCHDHSSGANIYIDMTKRVCRACGWVAVDEELMTTLLERNYLRRTNTELERELIPLRGLEYADDAIEELQCQLLDAQQEHTKIMRLLSRLTTRAKNRLNSIGTIVDLETIDLSTPESEEE